MLCLAEKSEWRRWEFQKWCISLGRKKISRYNISRNDNGSDCNKYPCLCDTYILGWSGVIWPTTKEWSDDKRETMTPLDVELSTVLIKIEQRV